MKNLSFSQVLFIVISILFTSVILPIAFAEIIIYKSGDAECFDNGAMSFSVVNTGDEIKTRDINIRTEPPGTDFDFLVKGDWRYYGGTIDEREETIKKIEKGESYEKTKFESLQGLFTEGGTYNIRLYIRKEGEFDYDNPDIEFNLNCPKFKYTCRFVNISILDCYNEGDYFYAEFMGEGLDQDRALDPYSGLTYELVGVKETLTGSSIKNERITESQKQRGLFTLQAPVDSDNPIKEIEISTDECDTDEYPQTTDKMLSCKDLSLPKKEIVTVEEDVQDVTKPLVEEVAEENQNKMTAEVVEEVKEEQNKITGAAVVETKEGGDQSFIQLIINWFRSIFS